MSEIKIKTLQIHLKIQQLAITFAQRKQAKTCYLSANRAPLYHRQTNFASKKCTKTKINFNESPTQSHIESSYRFAAPLQKVH